MLQANDIDVAYVEKISSPEVGRQILFFNFEADKFRIVVAFLNVVDGNA